MRVRPGVGEVKETKEMKEKKVVRKYTGGWLVRRKRTGRT